MDNRSSLIKRTAADLADTGSLEDWLSDFTGKLREVGISAYFSIDRTFKEFESSIFEEVRQFKASFSGLREKYEGQLEQISVLKKSLEQMQQFPGFDSLEGSARASAEEVLAQQNKLLQSHSHHEEVISQILTREEEFLSGGGLALKVRAVLAGEILRFSKGNPPNDDFQFSKPTAATAQDPSKQKTTPSQPQSQPKASLQKAQRHHPTTKHDAVPRLVDQDIESPVLNLTPTGKGRSHLQTVLGSVAKNLSSSSSGASKAATQPKGLRSKSPYNMSLNYKIQKYDEPEDEVQRSKPPKASKRPPPKDNSMAFKDTAEFKAKVDEMFEFVEESELDQNV